MQLPTEPDPAAGAATARPGRLRRAVVDLAALPPDRAAALADELYPVHDRVFRGLSRQGFAAEVLSDHAESTAVEVYRDPAGRAVGYCALHRHERDFLGRASTVYRAEAGLLAPWRGHASTWGFAIRRALCEMLRAPRRPLYYFGTLVHPSSYCLVAERFPVIHPHRSRETPPAVARAMATLADSFEYARACPDGLLRRVGWITRETPAQAARWAESPHPDVRFYRAANPDYGAGIGLVTLIPLTPWTIAGAVANDLALRLPGVRRWRGLARGNEGGDPTP